MDCARIERLLSDHIDGKLSARDAFAVESHVSQCNRCAATLNELRQTVRLLADAPRLKLSDTFTIDLAARLATLMPEPARAGRFPLMRPFLRSALAPAVGAAVGTAALAAVILFAGGPGGAPAEDGLRTISPAVTAARQSVAIAATDPFADIAAANLAARVSEETLEGPGARD